MKNMSVLINFFSLLTKIYDKLKFLKIKEMLKTNDKERGKERVCAQFRLG